MPDVYYNIIHEFKDKIKSKKLKMLGKCKKTHKHAVIKNIPIILWRLLSKSIIIAYWATEIYIDSNKVVIIVKTKSNNSNLSPGFYFSVFSYLCRYNTWFSYYILLLLLLYIQYTPTMVFIYYSRIGTIYYVLYYYIYTLDPCLNTIKLPSLSFDSS